MIILSDYLQYILLGINFVVTCILFGYAFYLYKIERDLRRKFNTLSTKAANIIEDANHKALHILTHSKYITDDMKSRAEHNFDHLLNDLRLENENFYKELEQAYFDRSERIMKAIEEKEESDIEKFSNDVSTATSKTKEALEKKIEGDYDEAKQDIEKFKELKKAQFEREFKDKVAAIAMNVLPQYLKIEDQEKYAQEVIEKAATEGFFTV